MSTTTTDSKITIPWIQQFQTSKPQLLSSLCLTYFPHSHHDIARSLQVHNTLSLPHWFPLVIFLDPAHVLWRISLNHWLLAISIHHLLLGSTYQAPGWTLPCWGSLWVLTDLLILQIAQITLKTQCSLSFGMALTWIFPSFAFHAKNLQLWLPLSCVLQCSWQSPAPPSLVQGQR